jgi:hypothetical protein
MGHSALPVDGHVHFHRLERVALTLDAATANFSRYGQRQSGLLGILLLTQARRERVFEALQERETCGQWTTRPSPGEEVSIQATHGDRRIVVVCGRQVRCHDGLEVTVLGTLEEFPDGLPLEETIRAVAARGAFISLPWGFGKWLGARGRVLRESLARHEPRALAICDNGSRLQVLGRPGLVQQCAARGHLVLPGTDPFPFGNDHRRTGSFGFLAPEPAADAPWSGLAEWLRSRQESPLAYGEATGLFRFMVNNVGIQLYNRMMRARRA